jgi:hypothetical protein
MMLFRTSGNFIISQRTALVMTIGIPTSVRLKRPLISVLEIMRAQLSVIQKFYVEQSRL